MKNHSFHIVNPRPWPIRGAIGALYLTRGLIGWINKYNNNLIILGVLIIVATIMQWWRDIWRESTFTGKHTKKVEEGLRLGMILFIIREVFLFLTFFWAFFHSALRPNIEIGSTWPPAVVPLDPFSVPLLNTTLLLSSGATITWAHMAMQRSSWIETNLGMLFTVVLGSIFSILQLLEYGFCSFTMSDSIYGSTFYIATGFHGLHVLFGTIFIATEWFRHYNGHFTEVHHFGFEARAWYWHFVDVIWLFLFICIYWWGY